MATPVRVLGLSAYYHDSAAALLIDGRIAAAAQEERFTRVKHDARFPANAIAACLNTAGMSMADIDAVVFYDKPFLKFERLLETYVAFAPRGFSSFRKAMPVWMREKLLQKDGLLKELSKLAPEVRWQDRLLFSEHHFSHAASAFFPSPFEEALVLTLDGVGEWTTTSAAIGKGSSLKVIREIGFPHSLGLLYSAFTYHAGFRVNSGEYKLMGLAPYGTPRYADRIRKHLIDVKPDGSFRLDQSYFNYCTGLTMTNARFDALFGRPPRKPDTEPLDTFHMDMAASVQVVIEDTVLRLTRALAADTGQRNLCLAGGVALNCVANGKLLRDGAFDAIWVQPAAGDAGGALGAAYAGHHMTLGHPRPQPSEAQDAMQGSYLGPAFSQDDVRARLTAAGARFSELSDAGIIDATASALADGKAVGWFQGRMEFGPRALGNRSILADPRRPEMQRSLNLKVKFRESFRPFAPSVLREHLEQWFHLASDSPYMLIVADVAEHRRTTPSETERALTGLEKLSAPCSEIPAVTHVDHSARVQTVHADTNPRYHALIHRFHALTGCPVLVNTSFNVRGEPIVATPEDAFRCFMGNDLDVLVIENCLLTKEDQAEHLRHSGEARFPLD
jgi:carbamoyltransferase